MLHLTHTHTHTPLLTHLLVHHKLELERARHHMQASLPPPPTLHRVLGLQLHPLAPTIPAAYHTYFRRRCASSSSSSSSSSFTPTPPPARPSSNSSETCQGRKIKTDGNAGPSARPRKHHAQGRVSCPCPLILTFSPCLCLHAAVFGIARGDGGRDCRRRCGKCGSAPCIGVPISPLHVEGADHCAAAIARPDL